MSNPFDQFAADVQAALPPAAPRFGAPTTEGYNPYAAGPPAPAQPPQPIMNQPLASQPQPSYGYPASNYGAPPAQYGGAASSYPPSNPGGPPNAYGSAPAPYGAAPVPYGAAPAPFGGAPPAPQSFGGGPGMSSQSSGGYPPSDASPYLSQGPSYGQQGVPSFGTAPPSQPGLQPGPDQYGSYGAPPPTPAEQPPAPVYGGYQPANSAFEPPMSKQDNSSSNGLANPFEDSAITGPPPAQAPAGYGADSYLGQPPAGPAPGYGADPYAAQPPLGAAPPVPTPYGGTPYGNEPWNAGPPQGPPQQPAPVYPPPDPMAGALVPSQQPPAPYGQQFYGQPYPPPQQYPPQQYQQQQQQPPPVAADPFAVFQAPPKAIEPSPVGGLGGPPPGGDPFGGALVVHSAPAPSADDIFAEMGFGPAQPVAASAPATEAATEQPKEPPVRTVHQSEGELPPGGEWYDAKIFTPTLGVMFFKPQELTDSLFLNTDRDLVDALNERPVVAFIVEGSSARSAGVELGHVLLKVNGVDVKNPKEASRLIKEGPRPLPLLFYVPNTEVVTAEGEHMVKYDTRETTAPPSAKDWKPKYVVIGGIIAQPWMINMYRSKSEYDIAVIETQARRAVSVKVKQFSLQGARILNDWQGPQMVKYKNKLHPWKYIVVLPIARNPIKISSPNLSSLKPVHEGIRRVLLAQQRDRGGGGGGGAPYATPVRDPYAARDQQNGHGREDYGERERERDGGGYNRGSNSGYDGPQGANHGAPPGGPQRQDPFFSGRY